MANSLSANIRTHISKGENHRLRSSGRIPGVIYGLKNPNFNVEFAQMELLGVLNSEGEHAILDVNVNGHREKAMIKEVQRHPVTRKIMHIDLQRIDEGGKIHAKVPLRIVGEESIRGRGAIAQLQLDQVEVECAPDKLPRYITADISNLPTGGRITLGDLEIAEEIAIGGDPNTVVASITYIKDMQREQEDPNEAMAVHAEQTK
ncbi:50S ribosomal protein L25 [Fonticella tunisiensis]|uniref:Large ribosomal subunit protein bL25 n=1 Tax=Fonticella tunisiensis TaxID=1096341 RepID=A0A4R7K4L3_9CLOT|nr:50S ribosomal protein L25 [Fonticella tunisiensis]TDT46096.1 LSU ribosomal protein L25P [Fonticella tunisiensis]